MPKITAIIKLTVDHDEFINTIGNLFDPTPEGLVEAIRDTFQVGEPLIEVEHVTDYKPKRHWFMVGIDGDETPDPAYWRERWECVEAANSVEAKAKWKAMRGGWVRPDEEDRIFVEKVEDKVTRPRNYQRVERRIL